MSEATANLCTSDACEELRARLLKYESADGVAHGVLVPDGWRLVPIEPTQDMLDLLESAYACGAVGEDARDAWDAALSCAPKPEPGYAAGITLHKDVHAQQADL